MAPDPQAPGPAWYCVRARPKSEHLALGRLARIAGLEVYCPRIRFRRATRRGPVWFTEALFPGYLFARFDLAAQGRLVAHASGVIGLVAFGGAPAVVPAATVDGLRAQIVGDLKVFDEPVRPGDAAEVLTGPFRGLEVVVTRVLPARDRVRVLLGFLGRDMEVEVEAGALNPKRDHPMRAAPVGP
jgi:transcriptional antiterminator RfaH